MEASLEIKNQLPCDIATLHHRHTCTPIFIKDYSQWPRNWNSLSIYQLTVKRMSVYTMEDSSAKKDEILSFVTPWMELDNPGTERQGVHELTLMWNINRWNLDKSEVEQWLPEARRSKGRRKLTTDTEWQLNRCSSVLLPVRWLQTTIMCNVVF